MKLSQIIAIAALLNVAVEEVAAIRRHHHSHHYGLVQTDKAGDDIKLKDPAFATLQKKKVELQE